jgi:hypothetical protein
VATEIVLADGSRRVVREEPANVAGQLNRHKKAGAEFVSFASKDGDGEVGIRVADVKHFQTHVEEP